VDSQSETGTVAVDTTVRRLLGSDAVIIAIGTLAGYGYSFAYEAGYCWTYGIPASLINLNLTTALTSAAVVGTIVLTQLLSNSWIIWLIFKERISQESLSLSNRLLLLLLMLVLFANTLNSLITVLFWWLIDKGPLASTPSCARRCGPRACICLSNGPWQNRRYLTGQHQILHYPGLDRSSADLWSRTRLSAKRPPVYLPGKWLFLPIPSKSSERQFRPELLTKQAFCSKCPRRSAVERRIPARFSTDPTGEMSKVTARRLMEKL
jgi:hypothetical protein